MNAVEIKATELLAVAAQYGFDGEVTKFGDNFIEIYYDCGDLRSTIGLTASGKVSVKTFGRRERIANYSFEGKLQTYKELADRKLGVSA